jgi:C-terminal processing protease CtpA/Prc
MRGKQLLKFSVQRMVTEVAPVAVAGDTIIIHHFGPGSGQEIADLLRIGRASKIDVRGNPGGSIEEVETALQAVIRSGAYAQVKSDPGAPLEKITLASGSTQKPKVYTVLVDKGTSREAEVFAVALRDVAGAKLEGGPMAGLARRVQRYALPDGSGYAITSGHYYDLAGKPLVREDERVKKARQDAMELVR